MYFKGGRREDWIFHARERQAKSEILRMCKMESSILFLFLLASLLWDSAPCQTPSSAWSIMESKLIEQKYLIYQYRAFSSCWPGSVQDNKRVWWRRYLAVQKKVCYHYCIQRVNSWRASRWRRIVHFPFLLLHPTQMVHFNHWVCRVKVTPCATIVKMYP